MNRRKLTTIIIVVLLIAGLSLLLYPTISNFVKSMGHRRNITHYTEAVAALDEETYEDVLQAAYDYNQRMFETGLPRLLALTDEEWEEYEQMLRIETTDVMAYISIPKVGVYLPIYHSTEDGVLQVGVGHLEGTSLPVGGENTHTVITAHRGLPSAKLFTNIDQLVEGDTFTIRVLREVLTYEVDDIQVVLPTEVSALRIFEGEDYCTLLTCTPYGVNTHRLLVRGHRIPTPEEDKRAEFILDNRYYGIDPELYLVTVMVLAAVLILIGVAKRKLRHR